MIALDIRHLIWQRYSWLGDRKIVTQSDMYTQLRRPCDHLKWMIYECMYEQVEKQ